MVTVSLVIRSSRVVLHERGKLVIVPARIHVQDAHIALIDREDGQTPLSPLAAGVSYVDLGDKLVTPAFVNAHTHLALAFMRGVSAGVTRHNLVEDLYFAHEQRLSPEDIRAFSRMGAYESLLHGVGFVWDHYYGELAVAQALLDTGLTGACAPTLQDLAGPGKHGAEAALAATLHIANEPRFAHAGVYAALGPHATDTVSTALFRRIADLAAQHDLPVHIHVAQSYDELLRAETREGRSPMGILFREGIMARAPRVLLAHALFAHEADLRALVPSRHILVACPSSQQQFALPAATPLWSELGCSWVIATDCASSNDSMNLQKELRICAGMATNMVTGSLAYARFLELGGVQEAGDAWQRRKEGSALYAPHVTSERLLARVWHEAGALHPHVKVGVIEAGALANLCVWDSDHPAFWPMLDPLRALAFSDTTQALHALYVAGKCIGEPGDFARSVVRSDAYREAREEATERLASLLGS